MPPLSGINTQVTQAWGCALGQQASPVAGCMCQGCLQKGCGWGKGPIWHAQSRASLPPQGLFRIFSCAQLMFSLTLLLCLQRAAALQGSPALRHFAQQSSQAVTELRGYGMPLALALAPLQSREAAPKVPCAGLAANARGLAPGRGQSSQEAQPTP